MNTKQAVFTALITVAMITALNQFDGSRQLLNGGNKFFR